ncbi:MAG: hypothetical protein WBG70_08630 [Spirulinaceae cyanobacterium]
MVKQLKQIEQEIATLEKKIVDLAKELQDIYSKYMTLLGESLQKQLVLASYQVCTQAYPEAFLHLSVDQRQHLQQSIQQIAKQTQANLLALLEVPSQSSSSEDGVEEENNEHDHNLDPEVEQINFQDNLPDKLLLWSAYVEKGIMNLLQNASQETNRLLLEKDILQKHIPNKVLEAAVEAEEANSPGSGPPNIINLLVEVETEENEIEGIPTPITAVNLRLPEIEFAHPPLNTERNQIRGLNMKLKRMRKQYKKKQQVKAIAEAESAWRSSWFEGS